MWAAEDKEWREWTTIAPSWKLYLLWPFACQVQAYNNFFIFVPYIFVLYIIVSLPRKLQGPVWMWQVWHSEYLYLYLYVYLYLHLHLHLHLQGPIMTMTSVTQQWRSDWGAFWTTAKRTRLQIAPRRHIFSSFKNALTHIL